MAVLNVLIAEDDPIAATLLALLLKQEGHTICGIVTKGRQVRTRVDETRPDVLLMDLHLADDVCGITVMREHLCGSALPVIIISGADSSSQKEAIAGCGAVGFVQKPVSLDELREKLLLVQQGKISCSPPATL